MKCPKCQSDNPDASRFCGNCASPLQPSDQPQVSHTRTLETPVEELTRGTVFASRYEIIEELGKGGMGKVYRVEDKKTGEELALKLIKPEISADKKTVQRFSNELKLAHKIAHRNVCRMFHLGEEKGTYYITMEYVPGEDLKSFIRRAAPLSQARAISIANQVCEGLTEAHRLGVVHRDLKPSNIMIDKEGNARIMDFGIARSLEAKGITGAGIIVGTPEYMSPEQAEAKEVDHRSDIYSLGVILYEMVTGQLPFKGDTPLSIAMKHKGEMPKNPKDLNPQIPEDMSRLILKCMEKDKDKRYQSAEDLHTELDNIEKGIPTTQRDVARKKPITSKEITVKFRLKNLLIPALAVVAAIVVGLLIWRPWSQKEAIPIPSEKPSLAILYFKNNTGDESLDIWRSAFSELLISDLSQSKYMEVLSADQLFSVLRKLNLLDATSYASEDLKEIASQERLTHILQGLITKSGNTFRINITLQEASTMKIVGSDVVEGAGEESFHTMVDELTHKIKANFKLTAEQIASDIDKDIGKITTSSPKAYKYYSEGRKYFNMGDLRESHLLMEKAVTIDPEFAMAYRSMAMSVGSGPGYFKYIQKAFELSDRVSDRERYNIQANYYESFEKTKDKAIEAYKKLLQIYPNDRLGNANLGNLYNDLEQWDKSIEQLQICVKNKNDNSLPYISLSDSYMAKGLYDKAREILEYYLNNFSGTPWVRATLAINYLIQEKFSLAMVEVEKGMALIPTHVGNNTLKGSIYLCQGDLVKAENAYNRLLELKTQGAHLRGRLNLGHLNLLQGRFGKSKDQFKQGIDLAELYGDFSSKSFFHQALTYLYIKSGNSEEALKECDKAWNSAIQGEDLLWQRRALYFKGLALLALKSMDEAQKAADELREMVQKAWNKKEIRLYYHLKGLHELRRNKFSDAIGNFKEALKLLPYQKVEWLHLPPLDHALFIDSLALAYYEADDIDKAREEYERITNLTIGRLHYGDIYAKSFYMLGKIHEQQGEEAKAIEHYEKFLDLWKDADPGIAEVEDARNRLADLRFPIE